MTVDEPAEPNRDGGRRSAWRHAVRSAAIGGQIVAAQLVAWFLRRWLD